MALTIVDVKKLPTHGGSLRVFARRFGTSPSDNVASLRAAETRQVLLIRSSMSNSDHGLNVSSLRFASTWARPTQLVGALPPMELRQKETRS